MENGNSTKEKVIKFISKKENRLAFLIGLTFLLFLIVIMYYAFGPKSSVTPIQSPTPSGDKLKYILNTDNTIKLETTDKPWCYDTLYSFTVSGSSSQPMDVLVNNSLTKTFPTIKLTQTDGSVLKDGEIINVTKTVYTSGFGFPNINIKSNYTNIIKGNTKDKNADKCELTKDGFFIDYDNICPLPLNLGQTETASGPGFIAPYIQVINDATFIDAVLVKSLLPVEYRITFFSQNGASGPSRKATYNPATAVGIYKPAFNIHSIYGINGLRIERLDPSGTKVLKEQYKDPISTITITGTGPFVLKDNQPFSIQPSTIKGTFSSFNSSFI